MNESFIVRLDELPELAKMIAVELGELSKRASSPASNLVDRADLAKTLGVSVPTVDRLVRGSSIPSTKIGKRRLFDVEQVRMSIAASGVLTLRR